MIRCAAALAVLWAIGASAGPVRDGGASHRDAGIDSRDAGTVDPFGPRKDIAPRLQSAPANVLIGERATDGGTAASLDRAANAGPSQVALPGFTLHLFVSEELSPDALRALIRPNVTVWLDTRSNMLRDSTLENLRRADASFVRFHPPITDVQQRRFSAALESGAWLDAAEVGGAGAYRLGGRALAVEVAGSIDANLATRIEASRPAFIWWSQVPCDADAIARFAALHGRKVMVAPSFECAVPVPAKVRVAIRSADVKLPPGADADHVIVWLRPDAVPESVRAILVKRPAAELAVTVGSSEADARKAAALLDALGAKRR